LAENIDFAARNGQIKRETASPISLDREKWRQLGSISPTQFVQFPFAEQTEPSVRIDYRLPARVGISLSGCSSTKNVDFAADNAQMKCGTLSATYLFRDTSRKSGHISAGQFG